MRLSSRTALLLPALALALSSGTAGYAAAKFHIGICTETVTQSEDDLRGAEQLIKEYGSVTEGGMVRHITYPDDFMSQQETVISNLVSLADDPQMKVVVTCNALPGVAEAYKRIRAKRPDIILLAALPAEDPLVIQKAADLAIDADFVSAATPSPGPPSSWAPRPSCTSPSPGTCPTRASAAAGPSWKPPARTWA